MNSLKNLILSYEKWVASNPDIVCDLETTSKWVSYFIAGRISDSNVVSELIYTLSNMLVLYNDRIIAQSQPHVEQNSPKSNSTCYRLKVILTTLEYSEVFIEISAKRIFGNRGKWIFIALIQFVKAAGRFFILKHSTDKIIRSPALPSLNRRVMKKQQQQLRSNGIANANGSKNLVEEHSITLQLKRSGRVIRKVEGAPPLQYRSLSVLKEEKALNECRTIDFNTDKSQALLKAEYLYIAKPLIHLAAIGVFGEKRWKQYTVSLLLDLLSIRLYYKNRELMNKEQKLELSRRSVNLLLYLARSPFYERYTQRRIERVLDFVANNIPLVRMIASPLKEYIPHWQDTYFYLWST
ncbi:peroxisomal membrane protein PEX16-like [Teleopsis dalmanni]|uniref:peroxisomal membrane protein PEX16-like n=1 Tax=Teleopsis dalmanni TaxID=139649 RepID=UPI0018CD6B70|nr:peroxisomal membrane protein PEX16-like [Teleopsis dalmanni]XP_037939305.1 peroxisomal membrane protein PEX16-like [Teleopsis dalmanni]